VYLAAGIVRLPFRIYLTCDAICATLVVGFFFALSYAFGEVAAGWIRQAEWGVTITVLFLVVAIGGIAYYRNRAAIYKAIFEDSAGEK
jgi:membrane protein DedA with SNARE-associated domain